MKPTDLPPKAPKILIVGPPGCGKTALLGTLGARAQIADLENGLRTLLTTDDKWKPDRTTVDVRQFLEEDPGKAVSSYAQFKSFVYGLPAELRKGSWKYQAVGVDSLSALARACQKYIMGNSGRLMDAPEIQHWGLIFTEVKNLLDILISLPVPLIVTAHVQIKEIGKGVTKEQKDQIAIEGKNMPSQVGRLFDEIWYMDAKASGGGKFRYTIQTMKDERIYDAKSRSNIPNFTDTSVGLWKLIEMCGYKVPA